MLTATRPTSCQPQRVVTDSGAFADVGPEESIRVFSEASELIFEYDPSSGKTRLHVPRGDLELVAPQGDIHFVAGGSVRMHGQSVMIHARRQLGLAIVAATGGIRSLLTLSRRQLRVESEQLDLKAATVQAKLQATQLEGSRLATTVDKVHTKAQNIETDAECIVENANCVFRGAKDLLQHTAGRMKTLVSSIYQLRAESAFLKTEQDFKVKGDKIHLG